MSRPLFASLFALATFLPAQDQTAGDPLAASKKRLDAALQKTAALSDTAFTLDWGPVGKKATDPVGAFVMGGGQAEAKGSGSWHQGLLVTRFENDSGDEFVAAGRRVIAKDQNRAWALRQGYFADGNKLDYLGDAQLLLQQLASWKLAIVHSEVGSIDDRPVEFVTATLNDDQVTEAMYSGMLPPGIVQSMAGMVRFAMAGAGGRPAATPPEATVDVAIAIDPATSLVQRIQIRAYVDNSKNPFGGQIRIARAGGGAVQVVNGAPLDKTEEAEEEEPEKDAPLTFTNGLPNRSQKKKSVSDFTVRLSDHGTRQAPQLSDKQRKLLGL